MSDGGDCNISGRVEALQVELAEQRRRAELDVVGSVFGDPGRLVPVAEAESIDHRDFWYRDLRCIYLAAAETLADRLTALRIAAAVLQAEGHWIPAMPSGSEGPEWSTASLDALAWAWPPHPEAVRICCRQLIALSHRQCEAADHLDLAMRILTDPDFLTGARHAAPVASRGFTMKPLRRRTA